MDGWMDGVVIGLFQLFFSYELNQVRTDNQLQGLKRVQKTYRQGLKINLDTCPGLATKTKLVMEKMPKLIRW
jgi:hypothetical protein